MREIKFRYVLKVYNTSRDDPAYYEWLELPIFTLSELEHNGLDKWILKNVEGIIETIAKNQFTGLKDKNGKEVYEGDVLVGLGDTYHVEWDKDEARWLLIYYDEHGTQWANSFHLGDNKDLKIIGNIYENPELLEEK